MALLLSALALSGCATYQARPLHPARSADALSRRNLTDPRLERFLEIQEHRPGPPRWDLETLTLVALYERPDLSVAAARLDVSKAAEISAAELPNPVLSLSPTYNATTRTPSPWKVGPVVSFLIQSYGARPARMAAARAQVGAAREALKTASWQLRGEVRTPFLSLWAARRDLALVAQEVALQRKYVGALDQRYQAGLISSATLNAAILTQNQAELQLAAARRDSALAQASLAAALGMPEAALRGVNLDFAALDRPTPPGHLAPLIHAALVSRPDVVAALDRYQVAEAKLRLAIAQQYPNVDIGPGYHYDQGDNKFILQLSLPLPLLNQNQGQIAAARASRRLARAEFLQVQTRVLGAIGSATADWRSSEAEYQHAQALRTSAARALASAQAAYAVGQIGRPRLIGAQIALLRARRGTLAASVQLRTALGRLEAALYHPFLVTDRSP